MQTTKRLGGREARRKMRQRGLSPEQAPIRPGMPGGAYKPLSEREVEQINQASLDILEDIGIADPIDSWRDRVVAAGGRMSDSGRLCFPRAMVEDAIATAGRNFVLCGREPRHDMDISGTRVYFGGGSATVEMLDADTGKYRETRLIDLYDTARLEDALDNMHFYIRSCIPRELSEARDVDINTAYACMVGTTKFFFTSFFQPEHLDEAVAMFDISLGGDGSGERFRERPFAASNCTFVVPPLRFAGDACRVLDAAARNGMPAVLVSAGQSGATAPAALAGALTQGNAEVLAGLTAMNLLAPGLPLLLGNCPFVTDLRNGAFVGGGGEMALLAAAAAQMANFYDLPSWVTAGMSSSKLPDAQSGWEKGYLVTLPALAGANIIVETTGVLADIIAISMEAFTLDSDMVSGVIRAVRGIEVNEDTLSVGVIGDVVDGPGHFLSHAQTLRLMETEYVYPKLADRRSIADWESDGSTDIRERARKMMRDILEAHYPRHVDPAADERIRERFDISLAPEDMRPGGHR